MNQCEMILNHLKTFSVINDTIARKEYGCRRLASRINDLRNQGYEILTETQKTKNRFNQKVSYANYYLKEK